MSDETPIYQLLEQLPQGGATVRLLQAFDYLVPGEWQNITSLEGMIRSTTGEEDESLIQTIGERAIALYGNKEEGYQRAVWLFQSVDSLDKLAGAAAAAHMIGEKFSFLGFMEKVTPSEEATQCVDAAVKFAAEMAAYCYCNGIPGDSVGDFVGSLSQYAKEDVMRVAAWVSFDCVLPLGPDFLDKILGKLQNASLDTLTNNRVFQKISHLLPGGAQEQKALIETNMQQSASFLSDFASSRDITQNGVIDRVRSVIDVSEDKLDYVAAAVDMFTNYYEHTGIQTVARRLSSRAYGEI